MTRLAIALATGIVLLAGLGAQPALAQVRGTITSPGSRSYPIAISQLKNLNDRAGRGRELSGEFADIVSRDLELSGLFRIIDRSAHIEKADESGITTDTINFDNWSVIGALGLVKGAYSIEGEKVAVEARLFDVYQRRQLVGRRYHGTAQDVRRMANKFADEIMLAFTGERGPFDSRIAFVSTRGGRFKDIFVMSPDGGDVMQVTRANTISLSPAWSPDVHSLLFTSFKHGNPDLYLLDFLNGRETQLTTERGLHIGGRFSPDGNTIAASVEVQGNSDIVLLDRRGKLIRRLTDHWGIDVSPSWSPDGQYLAFCSNRQGSPQIYIMDASSGGDVRRVTSDGNYNTSPSWSPKGDRIAYVSRNAGGFDVFTVGTDGSGVRQITSGTGNNEDPSWSPDGRYLVFSSTRRGESKLYVSDASGASQIALTAGRGGDTSPSWSAWLE